MKNETENDIDMQHHVNFFALFLGALGVAIAVVSVLTLSTDGNSSAPSPISTRPTITAINDASPITETMTSVKIYDPNLAATGFYSSVTIRPE